MIVASGGILGTNDQYETTVGGVVRRTRSQEAASFRPR
jgi:hypothetical protein